MNNNSKLKIIGIITSLCLCFSIFTAAANAEPVSENRVQAFVDTAVSQVDYYEGDNGYSKYGDYFGSPYVSWCCAFVAWCARTSGVPENVIPTILSCSSMYQNFVDKGLYRSAPYFGGNYIPKKGDLVFFSDARTPKNLSHIGIVVDANSSYVTCVEGNCPNRVRRLDRKYSNYVVGFATPEYGNTSVEPSKPVNSEYKTGQYMTKDIMNFRTAPFSTIITTIPENTVLEITETSGVWGKTEYNGSTGWLSLEYSTRDCKAESLFCSTPTIKKPSESKPADGVQYKVSKGMNLRSACSVDGNNIIGFIPGGSHVKVSEIKDGWGKTTFEGITGWFNLTWSIPLDHDVDWLMLDISQWQRPSELNWSKLKSDDKIDCVVIRIGGRPIGKEGNRKIFEDDEFLAHYKAAKAAGIHIGVYFYTQAFNEEEAVEEAKFTIDTLKKYNCELDMPVFIDIEVVGRHKEYINAGRETCSKILDTFCSTVEDAGYFTGIYCSRSFAQTHVDPQIFNNRAVWLAEWDAEYCKYDGRVDIWQYTEKGKISGASNKVDLSHCYVDYPELISEINFSNGKYPSGDVDKDGVVTASDARLILRCAVNLENFSLLQKKLADIDKDDCVSAADARSALLIAVGI